MSTNFCITVIIGTIVSIFIIILMGKGGDGDNTN